MGAGISGPVLIAAIVVALGYYTVEKVKAPVEKTGRAICHMVTFGKKCDTPPRSAYVQTGLIVTPEWMERIPEAYKDRGCVGVRWFRDYSENPPQDFFRVRCSIPGQRGLADVDFDVRDGAVVLRK